MAALVCGKRSLNSIFLEEQFDSPSPASKRIRCSACLCSSAAVRFSPPLGPSAAAAVTSSDAPSLGHDGRFSGNSNVTPLDRLGSLFPDTDQQFLERALEASGNVMDSAIKSLNDLRLESAEINVGLAENKSDVGIGANVQPSAEGMMNHSGRIAASQDQSAVANLPTVGSENMENRMLKEQVLLQENNKLKRAVAILYDRLKEFDERSQELQQSKQLVFQHQEQLAILHDRLKEFDEMRQELQQSKQLVSQYQEDLRKVKLESYAWELRFRQAQQSSSIPGRFHPDIF